VSLLVGLLVTRAMKTYPIIKKKNVVFAFEIKNFWISKSKIANVLRSIEGVSDVSARKLFERRSHEIEFLYFGRRCVVTEPFGDSSRYWIGPYDEESELDMTPIEGQFRKVGIL